MIVQEKENIYMSEIAQMMMYLSLHDIYALFIGRELIALQKGPRFAFPMSQWICLVRSEVLNKEMYNEEKNYLDMFKAKSFMAEAQDKTEHLDKCLKT
jgi:hypothetical protein